MLTMHRRTLATTIIVLLLGLTACAKPYRLAEFDPPQPSFSGIDPALTASGAGTLVAIHGMCHHSPTWFQGVLTRLARHLGTAHSGEWSPHPVGEAYGVIARKADIVRGAQRLRVYGILYSEVTKPLKVKHLCPDVKGGNEVCEPAQSSYDRDRAGINNALKNTLLNDCLADAVIYLGPTGETIRAGVGAALDAIYRDMAADAALATGPVMYLSESLGSKVLGDALVCSTPEIAERVYPQLARTSHLFLSANQIPLLNLGHRGPGCPEAVASRNVAPLGMRGSEGGVRGLAALIQRAQSGPRTLQRREPTVVVAFTDPNDLLSYEVDAADFGGLPVVNVIVSNDWTWFRVLENPLSAHRNYLENDAVVDVLRCGRRGAAGGVCRP